MSIFEALEELEGSHDSRIANGEIGRYCITKPFFIDAMDQLAREQHPLATDTNYEDLVNKEIAQGIIAAYWRRYCPVSVQRLDYKTLGAVFRKGPKGASTKTGQDYGIRLEALCSTM